MIVSLLFVLLGSKALAAPLEEDRDAGEDEDESEDDMNLSSVQKQMLAQFEIKNAKDQEEADNYNEDKKPAKGGPQTGASRALDRYHWDKGILYYDLSRLGAHVFFLKSRIKSALQDLMDRTNNCVQFVEKRSGPRVEVHSHGGCLSAIGNQAKLNRSKRQILRLGLGCWTKGTIQHEFVHALGFYHSQMRSDRDKYIEVKWDNIRKDPKNLKNFKKYTPDVISHYGLPFDYESIMLYGSYQGSNNYAFIPKMFWKKTIVTKDPSKQDLIGNRKEASAGDIKMIKKAYEFTGREGCFKA